MTKAASDRNRYLTTKRAIDLIASLAAVVALSPVLAATAIAISLDSRGPILFRQPRLGQGGRAFVTYKFRTMIDRPRVADGEIIGHHADVTRVGRVLRRVKIDELPQLFNVLFGQMSLVGPRPALPEQLTEYTPLAHRRLEVRPGLTGLAQVNGNIYLSWPERWELDAQYVDRLSFWLDLRILLKTVAVLVVGEQRFRPARDNR